MADEQTNPRIEELKARLAADPGSRVFYQLGEELRKSKRPDEAEQVLREGLEKHSSYLSAWISLGRVLKESGRAVEAIPVLNRAFELDRQNVVVARLLGESYVEVGENVEAIKKYKLVAALHPADEEVQERILDLEERLRTEGKLEERTSRDAVPSAPPPPPPPARGDQRETESFEESLATSDAEAPALDQTEPVEPEVAEEAGESWTLEGDSAAEEPTQPFTIEHTLSADEAAEPVRDESPSWQGEPGPGSAEPLFASDEPSAAPAAAIDPSVEEEPPLEQEDLASADESDIVATVTMGDLYARQGHVEQAREIYRRVLARDPSNEEARQRIEASDETSGPVGAVVEDQPGTERNPKVRRLEEWLSRVNR